RRLLDKSPPRTSAAVSEAGKAMSFGDKVASWGKFALLRVKRDKRRRQRIDVAALVNEVLEELKPVLEASSISTKVDFEDVLCRTFPMDIESIFVNLI